MLVEVKGVHFENQGAHLMLLAVLERLRKLVPGTDFVLSTSPNSPSDRVAALGAMRKLRLRKRRLDLNGLSYAWPRLLTRSLLRRGLVAEGQLDAVLDASGFAYGGDWTPWLMRYASDEITRLAAHGRPYIFLPQAFGPFPAGRAASGFGAALERAALVCVRDARSERFLSELNPRLEGQIKRFPDFTIGMQGNASAARRWGVDERVVLLIPNRQMIGERNRDDAWREGYVAFLVDLAGRIRQLGREVMLLNHEGRADAWLCESIAAEAGALRIITETDPRAVKGIVGAAAAVVSSRVHGCVAALAQGVPCLGTSWSHKYRELFDEFGVGEWLLTQCSAAAAEDFLVRLLSQRDAHSRGLLVRAAALQARVEQMWQRVGEILQASHRVARP